MVGAEEVEVSLRMEAGTATNGAITNRERLRASHATGISSTQFCQNPIHKKTMRQAPRPCSRLTACQTPKLKWARLRLSHRPSDGLEIQNQLICGSPTDGGPPETGVHADQTLWASPLQMVQRLTRF
jgi:hypothetical protein